MGLNQVIFYPSNEVVLERALDELMKDIRCEKLMYVCLREVIGERLKVLRSVFMLQYFSAKEKIEKIPSKIK
jgi:hypothetical protein